MKRWLTRGLAIALGLLAGVQAQAKDFPDRPIHLIAHVAAGGSGDAQARFVAERLARLLEVPVVVENRPGAGGMIAAAAAKAAPADGYTLLLSGNPGLNQMVTGGTQPFDAQRDFRPIAGLTRNALVIATPAASKLHSVPDLLAAAAQKPGLVGIPAGTYYLVLQWFSKLSKAPFSGVRYQGSPQMLQDLLSSRLDWAIADLAAIAPYAKTGQLRIVATLGQTRLAALPEVPTVQESGFPGFSHYAWNALFVRTETPAPVARVLVDGLHKVLASPEWAEYVKRFEAEKVDLAPQAFQDQLVQELVRYRGIANEIGFKPD